MDSRDDRKWIARGIRLGLYAMFVSGSAVALADVDVEKNAPSQSKAPMPPNAVKQNSTFTPAPTTTVKPRAEQRKEEK